MLTKLELVIDAYASNMLNVIVDFKYWIQFLCRCRLHMNLFMLVGVIALLHCI